MKTLAFALALTTTLAFSPNAQAGEKLTPQERATGAVSILFYQKHCDTIPAKVKLGFGLLAPDEQDCQEGFGSGH